MSPKKCVFDEQSIDQMLEFTHKLLKKTRPFLTRSEELSFKENLIAKSAIDVILQLSTTEQLNSFNEETNKKCNSSRETLVETNYLNTGSRKLSTKGHHDLKLCSGEDLQSEKMPTQTYISNKNYGKDVNNRKGRRSSNTSLSSRTSTSTQFSDTLGNDSQSSTSSVSSSGVSSPKPPKKTVFDRLYNSEKSHRCCRRRSCFGRLSLEDDGFRDTVDIISEAEIEVERVIRDVRDIQRSVAVLRRKFYASSS